MAIQCSNNVDGALGPTVSGCRDNFDFAKLFEDTFFAIAPSAILLLAAPFHLVTLLRQVPIIRRGRLLPCKLVLTVSWIAIQVVLLVDLNLKPQRPLTTTMAAAALSVINGVTICVLSYFSHARSSTPSTLLLSYLGLSLLLDVPRLRTSWLQLPYGRSCILAIISLVLKSFMFVAEAMGKRSLLRAGFFVPSPDAMIGLVNRSVFWWTNDILLTGTKRPLKSGDIYEIDVGLAAHTVYDQLRNKLKASELLFS
jgi:ATP-binding cassette subfamily C (CFTR/MRP) protein 1